MIKNVAVVFCDCFNTIIGRTKHPDAVLYDWATSMNKSIDEISVGQFFSNFKSCWKKLEYIDNLEIEESEFLMNINQIFTELFVFFKNFGLLKNFNQQEFVNLALDNYIKAESDSHYLKSKNFKFLQKQKNLGKKVYLVSDFYCGKKTINQWLKNVGIENFFDDIFVSCDFKKSKKTGSLYAEILNLLQVQPQNVLMFGDNVWSDNIMAKRQKLKTKQAHIYIKLSPKNLPKQKLFIPQKMYEIFADGENENIYTNYAFPLFLFTKRLFEYCQRHNIKEVFFLAREGQFLKTLFDEYIAHQKTTNTITTHYFVCSRRSLLNATLTPYDTRLKFLVNKIFLSPHNFLATLHFSKENINDICKHLNINENHFYLNFGKSKAYRKLIESKMFNDIYEPYNKSQNQALKNYASICGINEHTKDMFIVDSGWHGTMQQLLKLFFEDKVNLSGCYIGLTDKNARENHSCGLLFAKKQKTNINSKILAYRVYNYEGVLRCEDGTCEEFENNAPILNNSNTLEKECFYSHIKPFQEQVFSKFKQIMQCEYDEIYNIESVMTYFFYRMMSRANKKSRKWYDEVQNTYSDSFGYLGYTNKYFGKFFRLLTFYTRDFAFKIKYSHNFKKNKQFWT